MISMSRWNSIAAEISAVSHGEAACSGGSRRREARVPNLRLRNLLGTLHFSLRQRDTPTRPVPSKSLQAGALVVCRTHLRGTCRSPRGC
jgi:hypothetical protein